jgi:hypothetical protein
MRVGVKVLVAAALGLLLAALVTLGGLGCGGGTAGDDGGGGGGGGTQPDTVLETVLGTTGPGGVVLSPNVADAPAVELAGDALPTNVPVGLRVVAGQGAAPGNPAVHLVGHTAMLDLGPDRPDRTRVTVRHAFRPGPGEFPCVAVYEGVWLVFPARVTDQGVSADVTLPRPLASSAGPVRVGVFSLPVDDAPGGSDVTLTPAASSAALSAPSAGAPGPGHVAVVVHGFFSSSTDQGLMPLANQLQARGYSVWLADYNWRAPIDSTGQGLANAIETLSGTVGTQVDVFAHSMGGLVARSATELHGADAHVANLVTMGTPHTGLSGGATVLLTGIFGSGQRSAVYPSLRDLTGATDLLWRLNGTVSHTNCRYWSIGGDDATRPTPYPYTTGWLPDAYVDSLLGGARQHDGLIPVTSSLWPLQGECAAWAWARLPLNHNGVCSDATVFAQIDDWLGLRGGASHWSLPGREMDFEESMAQLASNDPNKLGLAFWTGTLTPNVLPDEYVVFSLHPDVGALQWNVPIPCSVTVRTADARVFVAGVFDTECSATFVTTQTTDTYLDPRPGRKYSGYVGGQGYWSDQILTGSPGPIAGDFVDVEFVEHGIVVLSSPPGEPRIGAGEGLTRWAR